jgi:hypothetical protein
MALNSSGPISLGGTTAGQSIALENGGSGTSQISLNDAAVRGLAGVASGAITMPTDFYGKSNAVYFFCYYGSSALHAITSDSSGTIFVGGEFSSGGTVSVGQVTAAGSAVTTKNFSLAFNTGSLSWLGWSAATPTNIFGGTFFTALKFTTTAFTYVAPSYRVDNYSGAPVPYPFSPSQAPLGYGGRQLPNGSIILGGHYGGTYCCSDFIASQWRLYNSSYAVINGAASSLQGTSVKAVGVDSNNNFYLGNLTNSSSNYYPQAVKYNSSGSYLGSYSLQYPNGEWTGLVGDSSGNGYGCVSASNLGFVVKWNSSFTVQWKYIFNASNSSTNQFNPRAIDIDSSGNVYVSGINYYNSGNSIKLAVLKFNNAGTLQWRREWISNSYSVVLQPRNQGLKVLPNGSIAFCYKISFSSSNGGFAVFPADGSKTGTYTSTQSGTWTWQANTSFTIESSSWPDISLGNPFDLSFTNGPNANPTQVQNAGTLPDVRFI